MKCNHEITIYTGKQYTTDAESLDELLCLRCNKVIHNLGEYEECQRRVLEQYEQNGFFKRYKIYTKI